MAYLKTDQQRIKELLSETIVLLCKNGLHFETEFSVEALIAITLDQKDIFLVSIKETVETEKTTAARVVKIEQTNTLQSGPTEVDSSQSALLWRSSVVPMHVAGKKRRYPVNSLGERCNLQRRTISTNSSYCEKQKMRKQEKYSNAESALKQNNSTDVNDCSRISSFCDVSSVGRVIEDEVAEEEKNCGQSVDVVIESHDDDVLLVKDEPSSDPVSQNDPLALNISAHKTTRLPNLNNKGEKGEHSNVHAPPPRPLLSQASLYSSWVSQQNSNSFDPEQLDNSGSKHVVWHPAVPSLLGTSSGDFRIDHASYCPHPHPNLSPDELSTATAILTIPGAFINLGCVKAVRQKLRKVPKEVLVIILESMSVIRESPFFVGVLRCEGISRTFYKCPPSAIRQEALDYYQLDYSVYADLYNGPVKVPNNIKDPFDWIMKTKMLSPFSEQKL